MGSLNGDVVVIRNGRSTSHISVYNYPEHLNPFYEEDQHKRLRFWKINKSNNNRERRSSLSIANLKEMWAFKSFRSKKRSSMLGINKTSESPPAMRRGLQGNNNWNTLDHRVRHSTNASPLYSDSLQRDNVYRSSLQNIPAGNVNDRIGFNRNDNYRSTIQFSGSSHRYPEQNLQIQQKHRRYVYRGSLTPQPLRSIDTMNADSYEYININLTRGSSQTSMASTNPFETDNEDNADGLNVSEVTSLSSTKRTPRKKRRAPAPPPPFQMNVKDIATLNMLNESSQEQTQNELCIREQNDIANLTAEIQTFVQIKNNDDIEEKKLEINKPEADFFVDSYEENNNDFNIAEYEVKLNSANKEKANEESASKEGFARLQIKETNAECLTITKTTNSNVAHKESKKNKENEGNVRKEQIVSLKIKETRAEIPTMTAISTNVAHEDELVFKQYHAAEELKISNKNISKPKNVVTKEANQILMNSVQTQPIAITKNKATNIANGAIKKIDVDPYIATQEIEIDCEDNLVKPIPMRRKSKTESELGQVECIHVHMESPRSITRHNHPCSLTSFKTKTNNVRDQEKITAKTSFTLVSPPITRKDLGNLSPENLNAKSENQVTSRPEISPKSNVSRKSSKTDECELNHRVSDKNDEKVKPPLSPKPLAEVGFAEIRKPSRRSREAKKIAEESVNMLPNDHCQQNHPNELQRPDAIVGAMVTLGSDLKIVENSTTKIKENIEQREQQRKNSLDAEREEFDALYRSKPSSLLEWKKSSLATLETNIPLEKRKSVKEIIASINRSQRLLHQAANKDFPVWPDHHVDSVSESLIKINQESNANDLQENLKILDERERDIKRMVEETDCMRSSTKAAINEQVQRDAQKLDNNEIFQKCTVTKEVYDCRESSPISSNLDWNPLPKPKRIKPLHE
uniref:Uncharacterized protein n=1 Tax=Glossina palpalis gambiensis TaxID=67801 RepID=A0A1B0C656_9MUSC